MPEPPAHQHVWEPIGIVTDEKTFFSPVSAMDHTVVERKLAVQSCGCGAIRRVEVGRKERWLNR